MPYDSAGSGALSGAGTGAAVGTMIMPGIGSAAGAVIGGIGGAIAGWLHSRAQNEKNKDLKAQYEAWARQLEAADRGRWGYSEAERSGAARSRAGLFEQAAANRGYHDVHYDPALTEAQPYPGFAPPPPPGISTAGFGTDSLASLLGGASDIASRYAIAAGQPQPGYSAAFPNSDAVAAFLEEAARRNPNWGTGESVLTPQAAAPSPGDYGGM